MTERIPEVGQDVEAYCTSCKMDLVHVVAAKLENVIKKVRCKTCGKEHLYRPPKGKGKVVPRTRKKAASRRVEPIRLEDLNPQIARPYKASEFYTEGDVVDHPKFGLGHVAACVGRHKINVEFEDGPRLLICNRT